MLLDKVTKEELLVGKGGRRMGEGGWSCQRMPAANPLAPPVGVRCHVALHIAIGKPYQQRTRLVTGAT